MERRIMNNKEKEVFENLMDLYEFEVICNDDKTLSVQDLQGGNLGDIESEKFRDEYEILDRMDIYHEVYIMEDLERIYENCFYSYKEWLNFLKEEDNEESAYFIPILELLCKED